VEVERLRAPTQESDLTGEEEGLLRADVNLLHCEWSISLGSDPPRWGFTGCGDVLDGGARQDQHWEISHTQDQRYDEDSQRPDTPDDRVLEDASDAAGGCRSFRMRFDKLLQSKSGIHLCFM
jgi:hypothetical protein